MKTKYYYYSKCPLCKDYREDAISLQDAREKVEKHEKKNHKGKRVGIFGKGIQMTEDICPCHNCEICSDAAFKGVGPHACTKYKEWKKRNKIPGD